MSRRLVRWSWLVGLASAAAACHPAAAPATTAPTALADGVVDAATLDAALTPFITSYGHVRGEAAAFSGYVLVQQGPTTLYGRGFGSADRAQGSRPDADTSFRIGSTSKQFTAAAIMLLAQDGKVDVDAPISRYLPDYPAVGASLTLAQLLSHTSGLPEYLKSFEPGDFATPRTPAELLATFDTKPLDFPPGSAWSYSNSGYLVLGAIIERVSGLTYGEFMRTRVFAPAGLTRTTVGDAAGLPNRAHGYQAAGATLADADPIDMSVPFAAGAIRSTATDLARWHHVLATDAVLSAASRARMTTEVRDGYGLGWFLSTVKDHPVIGHGGNIHGFNTGYLRVPDLDLVVVVWSNNQAVNGDPIAKAALEAALGGTPTPVVEQPVVALDMSAATQAVGTYVLDEASRVRATAVGLDAATLASIASVTVAIDASVAAAPVLTFKPIGQGVLAVDALDARHYERAALGIKLAFDLPASGPATAVTLTQGGLELRYARTP